MSSIQPCSCGVSQAGDLVYCCAEHARADALAALAGELTLYRTWSSKTHPSIFKKKYHASKPLPPLPYSPFQAPAVSSIFSPSIRTTHARPHAPHPPSHFSVASSAGRSTPDLSDSRWSSESTVSMDSELQSPESPPSSGDKTCTPGVSASPFEFDHTPRPAQDSEDRRRYASRAFLTPPLSTETALERVHDDLRKDSLFVPFYASSATTASLPPLPPFPPMRQPFVVQLNDAPLTRPLKLAKLHPSPSPKPSLPSRHPSLQPLESPPSPSPSPTPSTVRPLCSAYGPCSDYSPSSAYPPTSARTSLAGSVVLRRADFMTRRRVADTIRDSRSEYSNDFNLPTPDGAMRPDVPLLFLNDDPYSSAHMARTLRRKTGQTVLDELEGFHQDAMDDSFTVVTGSSRTSMATNFD